MNHKSVADIEDDSEAGPGHLDDKGEELAPGESAPKYYSMMEDAGANGNNGNNPMLMNMTSLDSNSEFISQSA